MVILFFLVIFEKSESNLEVFQHFLENIFENFSFLNSDTGSVRIKRKIPQSGD